MGQGGDEDWVFDGVIDLFVNFYVLLLRRLHIETNCGRHRTWNCIQCSPNLLTKDALAAHIELQHPSNCDEDDTFVVPKVEVTLIEDENMSSSANFVDPLDVVLKDGNSIFVDAQHSRNISMDEDKEEPPIEK